VLQALSPAAGPVSGAAAAIVPWDWGGSGWTAAEALDSRLEDVDRLAVAVSPRGALAAIYAGSRRDLVSGEPQSALLPAARRLEVPPVTAAPVAAAPVAPHTPTPAATPAATAMPQPTAPLASLGEADGGAGRPLDLGSQSRWAGPLAGIIPAGLVVLIVFVVASRYLRGYRR
jgi:hypothetical protein